MKKFNLTKNAILKLAERENISYNESKYRFYRELDGEKVEKENLEKLYLEQQYSLPRFKKEFGWDYDKTQFLLDYHSILKRGRKEASNTDATRKQYKETCLDRFGVINVSQAQEVKDKKENSALEKYGCINVFQAQEIKNKSKETMLDKYGVERTVDLPWHPQRSARISKPQIALNEIINKLGYETEMEKGELFKSFNETFGKVFNPCVDIWLAGEKLVFEMYGSLWHADPSKYDANYIVHKFAGPTLASEIWEGDRIREEHIRSHGYTLVIIWENELKSNKQKTEEKVKQAIDNYFNSK